MLKSEHLIFRINRDRVIPKRVEPDNPEENAAAARLIELYTDSAAAGTAAGELAAAAGELINGAPDAKIAAACNKLLLDRCEFSGLEADYEELRRRSFAASAALLKSGSFTRADLQQTAAAPDLYGDLPDFRRLNSFTAVTPGELLESFNLAQAQGLLYFAESVTLKLAGGDYAAWRLFLQKVRFFRLLAEISRPAPGMLRLEISGPLAIFGGGQKYALALASLLPAIVNLKNWELLARLNIRDRQAELMLSPENGLKAPKQRRSEYLPEEIKLFRKKFPEKCTGWELTDSGFINAGGQQIIFPDCSCRHLESGEIRHLEFFHKWHAGGLERRLQLLHQRPDLPLGILIDRSLVKDDAALQEKLSGMPELTNRCGLYRDFPGAEAAKKVLNALLGK